MGWKSLQTLEHLTVLIRGKEEKERGKRKKQSKKKREGKEKSNQRCVHIKAGGALMVPT